jgi:hypothetical protein
VLWRHGGRGTVWKIHGECFWGVGFAPRFVTGLSRSRAGEATAAAGLRIR